MSFIFGGDTGLTPEQAKRRRQMAHQMAFGGGTPQNLGQGIDALGGALAGVLMERAARSAEKEGRASADKAWGALWGDGGVDPVAAALAGTPQPAPQADAMPAPMPDAMPGPVEQFNPATGAAVPPQQPPTQWATGGKAEVAAALARNGADGSWTSPANLPRIVAAESGGDPAAVSEKGATGLMQIMPGTARKPGYGVPNIFDTARAMGIPVADESDATLDALLKNPGVNKAFGMAYMRAMEGQHGPGTPEALAAYNAGPGAVAAHGGVPPYAETQGYVAAVGPAQGGAPASPPPAPPQGAAGPQGPSLAALAQAMGNPWLSDGQKAVVQALLQQRLAGSGGPLSAAGKLEADYRAGRISQQMYQAQMERMRKGGITINTGGKSEEWGAPPKDHVWVRGADGRVVTEKDPSGRGMRPLAAPVSGTQKEENRMWGFSNAVASANSMLDVIDGLKGDPQLKNATGWGSHVPFDLPGINSRARGRMAQLEGQMFLQAFESLKGAGQITEIEGQKAQNAIARLRTTLQYPEYIDALNELRGVIVTARDRANSRLPADQRWKPDGKSGEAAAGAKPSKNAPPAPAGKSQEAWQAVWDEMSPEERREYLEAE